MKALIVSGFDWKDKKFGYKRSFFNRSGKIFKDFLINDLGLRKEDVFVYGVDQKRFSNIGLMRMIEMADRKSRKEPLVIYYTGHGFPSGWAFSTNVDLSYRSLIEILNKRLAPLIVINDCCFAMSMALSLKKMKCRHLLIGITMKNRIGYDDEGVIKEVLRFWRAKKLANPRYYDGKKFRRYVKLKSGKTIRVHLRRGSSLDYLFYPNA
jgi:hypothetical protein